MQPFMALGKGLKQQGHRVRLATHAVYRDFVEGYGLEFYPLGGNPQVMSHHMLSLCIQAESCCKSWWQKRNFINALWAHANWPGLQAVF